MLEKSNNKLPFNLAFIEDESSNQNVIGHSRLCKVFTMDDSCFIESGESMSTNCIYMYISFHAHISGHNSEQFDVG